jgi:hypothetical protein
MEEMEELRLIGGSHRISVIERARPALAQNVNGLMDRGPKNPSGVEFRFRVRLQKGQTDLLQ